MSELALYGGEPAVREPLGTATSVSEADVARVADAARRGEISYDASEGLVAELEGAFETRLGQRYALATSSGTAALHSAFFGLGLKRGDEVLAPTYTYLATVMPIVACNATPVLVDAEPDTGNIDLADAERHVTPRTRAMVVTHLSGHPVDMERAVRFARRHGLRLVEDASQAHGAASAGAEVGTRGDVAAFSLQGRKLVAAGEGGMLVTSDTDVYERAVMLGHFAARSEQEVRTPGRVPFAKLGYGLNYRMHPLGAALALGQMERLDRSLELRAATFAAYDAILREIPGLDPAPRQSHVTRHAGYSYQPLYDPAAWGGLPRSVFVGALRAEGVPASVPSSPPLHREPFFTCAETGVETFAVDPDRHLYRAGELPRGEEYVASAWRLPVPAQALPADVLAGFAEAFRKVAAGAEELRKKGAVGT
ncbi:MULTISPECIES: DegT/DnrJ/EryC1/StrS family aminotransferase [Streptomyces]|uniref:DegT/DnrJ/EryC1/StrS family aminotransferase n=1 Tax=Streptomyces doudnae TaxID=3075536 RepID=A0ABD5EP16_9ACTN|nr:MULTISPECIES: DegT/DnrJ/EryC1/StrS family aminotransferase [unclassified Streptomyces]MDT0436442.1 DegT/DnrJ/EryC1/StrS family aminotransferase [Streptomyces sp. DSM 41981]MYQ65932.1 aminotransferase class V-fold PLP-dependent enzyme [Streptomyces sp. SID4950]SCE10542.1 dTDP-4-amino-4,6-dideoxygalactose transaminase [Streptomyces sp. SolWspMP-5a-2]